MKSPVTTIQRAAVLEILKHVQSSGIAFMAQPRLTTPEYSVDRALAEIEKILEGK